MLCSRKTVFCVFAVQTSSAETLPGAAQGANPAVVRLGEEHHAQPAEAGAAAHKGETRRPAWFPLHRPAPAVANCASKVSLSLVSVSRSCRSRMSERRRWRTAFAGSRVSWGCGWSSCRGARRGCATTARARSCRRRGPTLTEVSAPHSWWWLRRCAS